MQINALLIYEACNSVNKAARTNLLSVLEAPSSLFLAFESVLGNLKKYKNKKEKLP
jgi:hypothetical protein